MGWTYTHKNSGQSVREFFEKEFNCTNESGSWKILDLAVVNMREAYMAMEIIPTGQPRKVVGVVCLLGYSKSDYNFGYKDMDESMGPNADNCPARILDLLTQTEYEYALSWRERCRKNLNRPKLAVGQILKFKDPIRFRDGLLLDTFRVEKVRPLTLSSPTGSGFYKLPQSYLKQAEVIQGEKRDPEKELRALWDKMGVPKERQDAIIKETEEKAKPGAMVGPFVISE